MAFKINRKMKTGLISMATVLVLAGAAILTLMFMAKGAVNDFRVDASKQLKGIIDGKDAGTAVELRSVWLGQVLNGDYQKVKSLQAEYQKLLDSLKNYVAVVEAHNQLVSRYNSGLKGEAVINGDFLKLVNRYRDLIANRFPDATERIAAMDDLIKRVTATSDFDSISGFIAEVISDNDDWLGQTRDDLNVQISAFQKKIN